MTIPDLDALVQQAAKDCYDMMRAVQKGFPTPQPLPDNFADIIRHVFRSLAERLAAVERERDANYEKWQKWRKECGDFENAWQQCRQQLTEVRDEFTAAQARIAAVERERDDWAAWAKDLMAENKIQFTGNRGFDIKVWLTDLETRAEKAESQLTAAQARIAAIDSYPFGGIDGLLREVEECLKMKGADCQQPETCGPLGCILAKVYHVRKAISEAQTKEPT